jgi:hypothetical protein
MAGIKINDSNVRVSSVSGDNLIPTVDPLQPNVPKVITVDNMFGYIEEALGLDSIPEFDPTETYDVGEYTKYNDKMYRFISAKPAGAWDSTKVTPTDIYSELVAMRDGDYEIVTVTVTEEGTPVASVTVNCVALTTTSAVTNASGQCTFSVPKGVLYTIGLDSQPQGYYPIGDKAYLASYASRNVNFAYIPLSNAALQEEVTVLLFSGSGSGTSVFSAAEGSNITYTIDGDATEYTAAVNSGGVATFNVAMGSTYTISFPKIAGFAKPADRSYTAVFSERTVVQRCPIYVGEDEITILCEDGLEYTCSAYQALETKPAGVAIHVKPAVLCNTPSGLNDGKMCDFYIPKAWQATGRTYLSSNVTITNVTTTTTNDQSNVNSCHFKYTGSLDTDRLKQFVSGGTYTSQAYTYVSDKTLTYTDANNNTVTLNGFIPAFGQLWIIKTALTTINTALGLIGGNSININSGNWWSATQSNNYGMWNMNGGNPSYSNKGNSYNVLVVFA